MASTPENGAQRVADFVGSIGVNTHIAWTGPWADWSNVEAELSYIGVSNVREGVPYAQFDLSEFQRLADQGIKFDIVTTSPNVDIASDLTRIDALEKSNPGSVVSIEGTNEFNVNHDIFNGQDSYGNPAWGAGLDAALSNAVAADPELRGTTVVAASFSNAGTTEIAQQGNISSVVGASNWHEYFGQGSQPGVGIQSAINNAQLIAPGRPVYITETGYYTAINAEDWGGGGVNQDAQAKMTINLLLDAYKDGASKTFIYELMDNVNNPSSTDLEDSLGIFNGDGTPKAAATALHNLTSLISDTGSTAKSFAPGSLEYTLAGTTAQDNSLLLEKSDGVFDLALWNEQPIWDEATNTEIPATTHTVTLNLGEPANVNVYDVLTGSLVTQSTGTNSVNVLMSDRPMIVEVTPTPAAVCFAAGTLIRTERGDVAVETLAVGDVTITASGTRRPIRWLGHRKINCRRHPRPSEVMPVRIAAHAFGENRPSRDLLVSPGHSICVDVMGEVLLPAAALVNGTTILRQDMEIVTYWHVELDSHDIILAENLACESYLEMGNRRFFQNAAVVHAVALPNVAASSRTHGDFCRPFHADGPLLKAVLAHLRSAGDRRLGRPVEAAGVAVAA